MLLIQVLFLSFFIFCCCCCCSTCKYLSKNVYLYWFQRGQLHLRRVGVEARPDLVPGTSKGGSGGGSSSEENEKKDPDDPPKDDKGNSESSNEESRISPPPESSESHSLDDQLFNNAKFCHLNNEDMAVSLLSGLFKQQHTAPPEIVMRLWEIFAIHLLSLCVGSLYISLNCNRKLRQVL